MIVAVTGATGFIGSHLVTALTRRGIDVRAIIRPGRHLRNPDGAGFVAAALELTPLTAAFEGVDVVVNLAGVVSALRAEDYLAVNVAGARTVAEAARDRGARLIHVSSLAAAGPAPPDHPKREADVERPVTAYGRSKLAGERSIRAVPDLHFTILRPGAVYGPGDRAALPLFRWVTRGIAPLVGRPEAAYTFVHVADVVRAIEAAIERPQPRAAFFVGHRRPATAVDVLSAIEAAVARRARYIPVPAPIVRAGAALGAAAGRLTGRPALLNPERAAELLAEGFVCSVDEARERLGFEAAIDLPGGFADTAAWYKENGWL